MLITSNYKYQYQIVDAFTNRKTQARVNEEMSTGPSGSAVVGRDGSAGADLEARRLIEGRAKAGNIFQNFAIYYGLVLG